MGFGVRGIPATDVSISSLGFCRVFGVFFPSCFTLEKSLLKLGMGYESQKEEEFADRFGVHGISVPDAAMVLGLCTFVSLFL